MFSASVLGVFVLGLFLGARSSLAGSLLLSGYWLTQGAGDSRLLLLNVIPLFVYFIGRMKLSYQKEANLCIGRTQGQYNRLKDQDSRVLSESGHLENRFSDLSRVYEITRHLGRALDLEGLFQQLAEILHQTLQISSCWFVQLKPTEAGQRKIHRLQRLHDDEIKVVLDEENSFREEIALVCERPRRIHAAGRFVFPLLVENHLKGIWIVESADPGHEEALSIIAGPLALNMEKVELYNRIQELAILDGLTGVYVRRHFWERLQEEFHRSRQQGLSLSLLMCDLDHFKQKNDTYGHLVGDEVLKAVAKILKENVREVDLLGRYGGEEFSIALPETPSLGGWQVAERIRLAVQGSDLHLYDEKIRMTISIGVAVLTEQTKSIEELTDHADQALYLAKTRGRNRVEVYE